MKKRGGIVLCEKTKNIHGGLKVHSNNHRERTSLRSSRRHGLGSSRMTAAFGAKSIGGGGEGQTDVMPIPHFRIKLFHADYIFFVIRLIFLRAIIYFWIPKSVNSFNHELQKCEASCFEGLGENSRKLYFTVLCEGNLVSTRNNLVGCNIVLEVLALTTHEATLETPPVVHKLDRLQDGKPGPQTKANGRRSTCKAFAKENT